MREHSYRFAEDPEPIAIKVVETEEDLEGFRSFIRANLSFLGLDSETTGLDIYSDTFRVRLVQFGTPTEAWVVPVELGPRFAEDVRLALRVVQGFVLHNAAYDLQAFDQAIGVPMEDMWPKVLDTRILSHLVDPRGREDGGRGHRLEDLVRHYLDEGVANNIKTLMKDLAATHKTTTANIWKKVPLDDPHYQLYSGMDPIMAHRLARKLIPLVPEQSTDLISYEHKLAEICAYMSRTGFLVDVEYSEELSERLKIQEFQWAEVAMKLGCESVNSTEKLADALEKRGVPVLGRTPSGNRQVNSALLSRLAAEGDQFAHAVIEAKKARKWRRTWVDKFLLTRDSSNRCHPTINPLVARTARMSITGIPAQTLPADDALIRSCFIADEGHRIASVDYKAQELRVLAALSGDETMIQAFREGADLHLMTARAAFGHHVTEDGPERKYAKVVNFGRVYGGGAKTVADQTGLSIPQAAVVIRGFDRTYPKVQEYSSKLQKEVAATGFVVTPQGRVLPVDKGYEAVNYVVQSTSRDVTGRALIRLHEAGFTPYLRLPIHDEILASVPADKAGWGAAEIGRIMTEQMGPVLIDTDPKVGGRSWGSLYEDH